MVCFHAQLPVCATSGSDTPALLALALRLPPSASADWVVSSLAAALPQGTCMSSSMQLDIRTDIQVRILGRIPTPPTSQSSGSVANAEELDSSSSASTSSSEQQLWAAALGTKAVLVPPAGPSVSLFMGGMAQDGASYGVIAAASAPPSSAASKATSDTATGGQQGSSSGGSSGGSPASITLVALAAALGVVLLLVASAGLIWWLRYRRQQGQLAAGYPATKPAPGPHSQEKKPSFLSNSQGSKDKLWNSNTVYDVEEAVQAVGRSPARSLSEAAMIKGLKEVPSSRRSSLGSSDNSQEAMGIRSSPGGSSSGDDRNACIQDCSLKGKAAPADVGNVHLDACVVLGDASCPLPMSVPVGSLEQAVSDALEMESEGGGGSQNAGPEAEAAMMAPPAAAVAPTMFDSVAQMLGWSAALSAAPPGDPSASLSAAAPAATAASAGRPGQQPNKPAAAAKARQGSTPMQEKGMRPVAGSPPTTKRCPTVAKPVPAGSNKQGTTAVNGKKRMPEEARAQSQPSRYQ